MKTIMNRRAPGLHLLAELIGGAVGALALGLALGFLGARLFAGSSGGFGDLIGALAGMLLGCVLGASLGAYTVSRRLGAGGAYWLALLGSVLGAALLLLLAEPLRLNASPALLQGLFMIVPPLAAALGLNLRRASAP